MINKCKQKIATGFTLIETLVAVLILATAIAGPLTIASKGLTSALVAKDQTIAYYLAQDAVEYVRFARDTNRLKGLDWLDGSAVTSPSTVLTPCKSTDGTALCYFDSLGNNPAVPTVCPTDPTTHIITCTPFFYNGGSNTNYYTYDQTSPNKPTVFTRTVSITTPVSGNPDEASLVVKVSWMDLPGVTHAVTVQEDLFNWQ